MDEEDKERQRLQDIVDKSKVLQYSTSSLTPPQKTEEDDGIQIAIIRSLAFSDEKAKQIFFDVTGTQLINKKLEQVDPEPLMNLLGGKRLLTDLKSISEVAFSYIKEDDTGEYMAHFFSEIWPYYWANRSRFGINQMDMGHVKIKIQGIILAWLNQGKSAKLLNTVGRTFSEEWGSKILGGEQKKEKKGGFLSQINPLRKMTQ